MARAAVYAPDERQAMLLLLLPFLFMAAAIGINQSVRYTPSLPDVAATHPATNPQAARSSEALRGERLAAAIRAMPRSDLAAPPVTASPRLGPIVNPLDTAAPVTAPGTAVTASGVPAAEPAVSPPLPRIASVGEPMAEVATSAAMDAPVPAMRTPPATIPRTVREPALEPAAEGERTDIAALTAPAALPSAVLPRPTAMAMAHVATPDAVQSLAGSGGRLLALPPSALAPPLAGLDVPTGTEGETTRRAAYYPPGNICPAGSWGTRVASLASAGLPLPPAADGQAFGRALAAAAQRQVGDLVVYTDQYRSISYPMGDVAPLYGVCTDVIVRAYRALGLDLQALVHRSGIGSRDTSINHRRVETLRRFFAAYGQSLPVTDFPEDYRAGDIVSYYRPQNAHSRSHIAIVSDVVGPSGHLMIIHNRGWGPQLEDGLFVDEITGHYRYFGPRSAPPAADVATTAPQGGAAGRAEIRREATPQRPRPARLENGRTSHPARRREARNGAPVIAR